MKYPYFGIVEEYKNLDCGIRHRLRVVLFGIGFTIVSWTEGLSKNLRS